MVGISRTAVRYIPRPRQGEEELREKIRDLAKGKKRYGYRRIASCLRREGYTVNVKRVHRIWKAEGLGLPRRRPKRRRYGPKGEVVRKAERKDHVWSYDFLEDRTERGGKLRILTILDEYTRESLQIRVEKSMPCLKVIETLTWLFHTRGIPQYIRSDNGPEFVAQAIQKWLGESGCGTLYIEPGSPWENAYIESFNGKLRDECLNREVFRNGREAQIVVEAWRREYNECRPHSALGYLTPTEFARVAVSSVRATPSLRLQQSSGSENLSL
jgi:putative transposase